MSYAIYPTNPPVKGGKFGNGLVARKSKVCLNTSQICPSSKTPLGGLPVHVALPSLLLNVAELETPIKEYLDQLCPCSADSKRKVPGLSFAKALYKPTGVNESPISLLTTGMTLRSCA